MKTRFVIFVDGKWQGGSFESKEEAESVAHKLCAGSSKKWQVAPKGSKPAADSKK